MLGRINPDFKKCVVIGGGISGLILTHRLLKKGYTVELHEATSRLGGLIGTHPVCSPGGHVLGIAESAAHSILATDEVLRFFNDLEVELCEVCDDAKARFVFRNGEMKKIPFKALSPFEWIGFLLKVLLSPSIFTDYRKGLTLEKWGNWFLGRAATKNLLTPFVRGIYGTTPAHLSVHAAFPALEIPAPLTMPLHFILKKIFGPRKYPAHMVVPKHGMGSVIAALENSIRTNLNAKVILNSYPNLAEMTAQSETNVIIATDAHSASAMIGRLGDSKVNALAGALESITYTPMVSVTAIVKKSSLAKVPQGVGVLTVENSGLSCLGILFNSSSFSSRVIDENEHVSFTLMYSSLEDEKKVIEDLERAFGFNGRPVVNQDLFFKISRWPKAIPRYDFTLEKAWLEYRRIDQPKFTLFGNYSGVVSIRGLIETTAKL